MTLAKDTTCGVDNLAGGTYSITASNATTLVTAAGEVVTAGTVIASTPNGSIGTSCTSPFAINAANVTGNAKVNASFSDSNAGPITISNSSAGSAAGNEFYFNATSAGAGTGNILTGGTGITANEVSMISTAGSIGTSGAPITINASTVALQASAAGQNVYATDSAAGTVTLAKDTTCGVDNLAGGTYSFTASNATTLVTAAGEVVTAGTVIASTPNGSIGTSCTSPFVINAANVTGTAKVNASFSDSNAGPITISNSSAGSAAGNEFYFNATSAGAGTGNILTGGTGITANEVSMISTAGSIGTVGTPININASTVALQANAAGQNVYATDTATGTVTLAKDTTCGVDNLAKGTYSFSANNATTVVTAAGEVVTGGTIILSATSGSIGTSCTSPFVINTASLTAHAGVNASFSDSNAGPITITSSSAGSAAGNEFYFNATSAGAGTGNIATAGTGITANEVSMISTAGSIGTSGTPININASTVALQANAAGQNVYATDTAAGTVTLAKDTTCGVDNIASGTYSFTASNATTLVSGAGEVVTGGTVILATPNGSIGTSCTAPVNINAANVTATAKVNASLSDSNVGPITITSSSAGNAAGNEFYFAATSAGAGTGNIATAGSGITANEVSMISTAGSIGTVGTPITINASTVALQASGAGQNVYATDSAAGQ